MCVCGWEGGGGELVCARSRSLVSQYPCRVERAGKLGRGTTTKETNNQNPPEQSDGRNTDDEQHGVAHQHPRQGDLL